MSFVFGKPCITTLEFSLNWSTTESSTTISQTYYGGPDVFALSVRRDGLSATGCTFTLTPTTTFAHSYTIKTPSGSCLASGSLVPRATKGSFGTTLVVGESISVHSMEWTNKIRQRSRLYQYKQLVF